MAALTRQMLRTVTLAALALALQKLRWLRVIGSWKIEDKRDPISGKPWMLVQAGGPGSWIQIRCETVSDPGERKGLSLLGPAPAKRGLGDGRGARPRVRGNFFINPDFSGNQKARCSLLGHKSCEAPMQKS